MTAPSERQLVICHEVGRTFAPSTTRMKTNLGTCMDYTTDACSNQHPNAHAYEELETI
jgi:hypothetical protein